VKREITGNEMSRTCDKLCDDILSWAETREDFDVKFVASVKKQFVSKGKVSLKQEQALLNIIKRYKIQESSGTDNEESTEDEEIKPDPEFLRKWKDGDDLE
jgi:hypothetical protein